ncbi:MAG: DUF3391 domain-containing protein [Candidatus Polarisedimenticolaceae bacterium]|nr:DUF3391 domain-containing protein [Candidatus Polarisedimenticolaceae bacterium]
MYIHDLNLSWINHPFTVNQFKLLSLDQIKKIRRTHIKELMIDTDKGLDIEQASTEKKPPKETPTEIETSEAKTEGRAPLKKSLKLAAQIKHEAINAMTDLINCVSNGKPIIIQEICPVIDKMIESISENSDALLGLIRINKHDRYTFEHSVGVSVLLIVFGNALALDKNELKQLGLGGLLLDLGKLTIPPNILNKPGKLTDSEFAIIQKHVNATLEILRKTPGIPEIAMQVAAEHHERMDGSGYPKQLKGSDISFYGQMAAIADVFDAITTNQIHRKGISPHTALKMLARDSDKFNSELVYPFIHCLGIYPIGTLVATNDGKLAVVCESSIKGQMSPKIRIIFDTITRKFLTPVDIDLSCEESDISIVGAVEAEKWNIRPSEFLDHANVR